MKFFQLFSLTLICCLLPGITHVRASTLDRSTLEGSQTIDNILNTRFQELTRGINLNHWFAHPLGPNFNFSYITDKDLENIKTLGFEHIRLPIDPTLFFDENNPETLNAKYIEKLDKALDKMLDRDLSVIVNLSPDNEFKSRLALDDNFVTSVAQFWQALATHLSTRNPDQLFLETLNEPAFNYFLRNQPDIDPAQRWNDVQTKLLAAMRQGDPDRTLIAKGYDWDTIEGLFALTPVQDPNVVYNFHFYDPMPFTHQGASWTKDFTSLSNLPYPYNLEDCAAAVDAIADDREAKNLAQYYCDQKWDAAKLEAKIAKAASWAKEHNVLLTANEFGAYQPFVNKEDLVTWLRDVRSLLEKYDIGWAMWEYTEGFGLVKEKEEGIRIVYEDVADALAMRRKLPEPSAIVGLALVTGMAIGMKRRR